MAQQLDRANQCISCRRPHHVTSVNKAEKGREDVPGSSFLIIPARDITDFYQQHQLQDNDPSSFLEQVFIVKCTSCDKSNSLLLNSKPHGILEILKDETKPDGWLKVHVDSKSDRLVLFIMSQIIYREYEAPEESELQVEYSFPPVTDIAKILWVRGNAVGFYSLKPKGSLDIETMEWYTMAVIDTIFIRSLHRRHGYALSAIEDVLLDFPNQNVGFSLPISIPMIKVIQKYLELHPSDRMKLWEINGCGSEGNCQILWYLFKKRRKPAE